ncbi:MAG TPA: DUF6569 family protein [Chitinophagaceae bacterium]|nr:DUF6569 family protein [Chitinophagaceae bacterium]
MAFFLSVQAQFVWPVEVQYDSAWTYKNLKLIPVRFTGTPGKKNNLTPTLEKVISLMSGMKQEKVRVKEIVTDEGSDRTVLVVKNLSKDNILINRGDVVTGGKQDRMAAETTIIPPGKEESYLNVYCVEKGRWDRKPQSFKYYSPAEHKLKKVMDVNRTQKDIWKFIDERYKAAKKQTETSAYKDVSKAPLVVDTGYMKFFTNKFLQSDRNFCGFIAVTGNTIFGSDFYATTDMQSVQYLTNLSTYVDFAVQVGEPPTIADSKVEAFVRPIFSDEKTRNKFLEKHGRVFRYEGKIIHIVAYGD